MYSWKWNPTVFLNNFTLFGKAMHHGNIWLDMTVSNHMCTCFVLGQFLFNFCGFAFGFD